MVLLSGLFLLSLTAGDADIPISDIFSILTGGTTENEMWSFITEGRLNRTLSAILGGAGLSLSGLILQVYFRNPLAGPGVLGVTSGASLGVASIILGGAALQSLIGHLGVIVAGMLGAFLVLIIILFVARFIRNSVTLLVMGLMFSYFFSAMISVLYQWASLDDTRAYVVWGLGSFDGLSTVNIGVFSGIMVILIFISLGLTRSMNAMALGNEYAVSSGINASRTKWGIIFISGTAAAVVTVYCGPVSFIGIAVPQIVRMIWSSRSFLVQMPASLLLGAVLAVSADLLVRWSGNALPLNTVTALVGAPVIIYTILKLNKSFA